MEPPLPPRIKGAKVIHIQEHKASNKVNILIWKTLNTQLDEIDIAQWGGSEETLEMQISS